MFRVGLPDLKTQGERVAEWSSTSENPPDNYRSQLRDALTITFSSVKEEIAHISRGYTGKGILILHIFQEAKKGTANEMQEPCFRLRCEINPECLGKAKTGLRQLKLSIRTLYFQIKIHTIIHFSFYTDISGQKCGIRPKETTASQGNAPPSPVLTCISALGKGNTAHIGQIIP